MKPIKIESLDEFVKNICKLQICSFDELISQDILFKYKYSFRGQSDIEYKIIPSIARYKSQDLCFFERNLIEMAKFKLPHIFTNDLTPIELLSLLQHYGIPTRLLDVTENAFVALYFACESSRNKDKDGEVIAFLDKKLNIANTPFINGIADSYRFLEGTMSYIKDFVYNIIEQPYFLEQKYIHTKEKEYFLEKNGEDWIVDRCKQPFFVYAPFKTMRQKTQCGRYILFPNSIKDLRIKGAVPYFESRIEPLPKDHECIKMRICIPADKKEQILNDLKMFGISKGILFGDSVDKVCEDIKDSFK